MAALSRSPDALQPTPHGRSPGCRVREAGRRKNIPPRVARLPLDLLRHELILTHQPPSQYTLEEIVDEIFLPLTLHTS
ncbi:MAG: hypothetical protein ACRDJX_11615 [Solirubrobacteraceae bacterium]